ncbi:hypothetical protein ACUN0C_19300 [Faunimonas sp. B44]|uniref:hypothetical protein n=1 Tax=Faunimonas sp. B44 TaxID=3461493 RepID=UPI004043E02E
MLILLIPSSLCCFAFAFALVADGEASLSNLAADDMATAASRVMHSRSTSMRGSYR